MIEQIFRVRLDFEYPASQGDEGFSIDSQTPVDNALCGKANEVDADLNIFSGNAACGPYLEAEVHGLATAERLEKDMLLVLRIHGCEVQEAA